MVLPPSVHKSGRKYEWISQVAPVEVPHVIKELFDTRKNVRQTTAREFGSVLSVRRWEPLIGKLKEGYRYPKLFALGRSMRWGMKADNLTAELQRLNEALCEPPLDASRMHKLIKNVTTAKDRQDFCKDRRKIS
jgi:hypothetical protein